MGCGSSGYTEWPLESVRTQLRGFLRLGGGQDRSSSDRAARSARAVWRLQCNTLHSPHVKRASRSGRGHEAREFLEPGSKDIPAHTALTGRKLLSFIPLARAEAASWGQTADRATFDPETLIPSPLAPTASALLASSGRSSYEPPKSEETTPLETADRQEMSAQSNGVRHYRDVASGYTRSPT